MDQEIQCTVLSGRRKNVQNQHRKDDQLKHISSTLNIVKLTYVLFLLIQYVSHSFSYVFLVASCRFHRPRNLPPRPLKAVHTQKHAKKLIVLRNLEGALNNVVSKMLVFLMLLEVQEGLERSGRPVG